MNQSTFYLLLLLILAPFECFSSDQGPAQIEADKRDERALLEDVHPKMLVGTWYSNDGTAPIKITKTHLGYSDLDCKTPYTVIQKGVGKSYPDKIVTGRTNLEVGRYVTIKIQIPQNRCFQAGFLQFSFMTTYPQYSFANVVQYDEKNRPIAWYDLLKR